MRSQENLNLDNYWLPFTPNKKFKANPRLLTSAKGMFYKSDDGREVLDGIAGLWCTNAGHCHPKIVAAVQNQAAELDYATAFNMSHPKAFELAEKVSSLTPKGLDRIFYGDSGSEAVETAMKVALAYHASKGDGQKTKFIGREKGYHGVNFGGVSVGGLTPNRKSFGPLLPGIDHMPHTWDIEHMAFTKGQPEWGLHLADELEKILILQDPSTVAAVIIEPVTGSGGVIVPPVGYLERIREICTKHNVLLIFDEVITGFGRLGCCFAANRFDVRPDMITMAKGLTSAMIPMSAVAFDNSIYDQLMEGPEAMIELFHGYTYSGHPVACAAGIAALDVYEEEGLFDRAKVMEPHFQETIHSLKGLNQVIDIRNIGLMGAIHFGSNGLPATDFAAKVFQHCYDNNVLVRYSGEFLVLSPSLIVEKEHLDMIADALKAAITSVS